MFMGDRRKADCGLAMPRAKIANPKSKNHRCFHTNGNFTAAAPKGQVKMYQVTDFLRCFTGAASSSSALP
jgi:hypothetical protein